MTEEELHAEAHANAEFEIGQILRTTFSSGRRSCRADVLLKLLSEELMAMDDVEDVGDVVYAMTELVLARAEQDSAIFDTQGNA